MSFKKVLLLGVSGFGASTFATSLFSASAEEKCEHYNVLIVGGGTGGLAVANQLNKKGVSGLGVIEPSNKNYYQPGWTLVGAELLAFSKTEDDTGKYIPKGTDWIKDQAAKINPEDNKVVLKNGKELSYDYLVVATGLTLKYEDIPGLKEAVEADMGKEKGVCSIYSKDYVKGVFSKMDALKNGDVAIFTQPNTAIKCGGAPQKIMYLTEDHMRRKGLKGDISFIIPQAKIFGVAYMAPILADLCKRRGINTSFGELLVQVKGEERVAVFKKGDALIERKYDMLHVPPPMGAPDVLKNSPLANPAGFCDVDSKTLQHKKYSNVYSLGDSSGTPNAKTAAAVCCQAPILVHNLTATMNGLKPNAEYDGYSSCPIVTGKGKLLLAEFKYGGEPKESFNHFPYSLFFDQRKENYPMYFLKKNVFPPAYWSLLGGNWYGPSAFLAPKFPKATDKA